MMTLGNMRENGVRSLAITCGAVWCNHQAILDVNVFADSLGDGFQGMTFVSPQPARPADQGDSAKMPCA